MSSQPYLPFTRLAECVAFAILGGYGLPYCIGYFPACPVWLAAFSCIGRAPLDPGVSFGRLRTRFTLGGGGADRQAGIDPWCGPPPHFALPEPMPPGQEHSPPGAVPRRTSRTSAPRNAPRGIARPCGVPLPRRGLPCRGRWRQHREGTAAGPVIHRQGLASAVDTGCDPWYSEVPLRESRARPTPRAGRAARIPPAR